MRGCVGERGAPGGRMAFVAPCVKRATSRRSALSLKSANLTALGLTGSAVLFDCDAARPKIGANRRPGAIGRRRRGGGAGETEKRTVLPLNPSILARSAGKSPNFILKAPQSRHFFGRIAVLISSRFCFISFWDCGAAGEKAGRQAQSGGRRRFFPPRRPRRLPAQTLFFPGLGRRVLLRRENPTPKNGRKPRLGAGPDRFVVII